MTARVVSHFENGTNMGFQIKDGIIEEATYKGETVDRNSISTIKNWMESLFEKNLEDFKDFLSYIKKDADIFSYGRKLLDAEEVE